jgi:hypothetical protein
MSVMYLPGPTVRGVLAFTSNPLFPGIFRLKPIEYLGGDTLSGLSVVRYAGPGDTTVVLKPFLFSVPIFI